MAEKQAKTAIQLIVNRSQLAIKSHYTAEQIEAAYKNAKREEREHGMSDLRIESVEGIIAYFRVSEINALLISTIEPPSSLVLPPKLVN